MTSRIAAAHNTAADIPATVIEEMRMVCAEACRQHLLSGCNGNASLRLPRTDDGPDLLCITRSGAAKGRLSAADLCLMDLADGTVLCGGPISSETPMHLAVYRAVPSCRALLHTHPRRLLALSLILGDTLDDFLRLPLYEADVWRSRLGFAEALPPGSPELAASVAATAKTVPPHPAVWMRGHGLCCLGQSLAEALCLAEELEHLAAVQLLSLRR